MSVKIKSKVFQHSTDAEKKTWLLRIHQQKRRASACTRLLLWLRHLGCCLWPVQLFIFHMNFFCKISYKLFYIFLDASGLPILL